MRTIVIALVVLQATAVAGFGAETVSPAEVAPGSAGVCLTEMDGGELVEIPLTVLGVLGPAAPEREIVLVRLEDERFVETGIIAGMSGSPVYVDGRLLGALAFGWSFSKQPIGGVTPFDRMLQLGAEQGGSAGAAVRRPGLGDLMSAGRVGALGNMVAEWLVTPSGGELHRLPLPVSVGGSGVPTGSDWLAEVWRRLGWVGAPGGAAGHGGDTDPPKPGAMVAAVLVDGDATVAAAGTVTEVRGDQVWAFGHPFLGAGGVGIPLARARVLAVLPSQAVSFKMFDVGEVVGALRADRTHGVWGRIGAEVPMVPVEVEVDGNRYRFRSVRHPVMFPVMAAFLTQASLGARGRTLGDQTIGFRIEVDYGDRSAVLAETFTGEQAPLETAAMAAAVVGYLENSPFDVPAVGGVRISLETAERLETATIVDAVPERLVVRPGETLRVRLRMRPYRGDEYSSHVELQIPPEVPEGRLDLVVADGASWTVYDLQMRPQRSASFSDELRLFERLIPSRRAVLALERRQPGVALSSGSVAVPPSLVVQMRAALGPNLVTTEYGVVGRTEKDMPTSVSGAQRIPLTVRQVNWEGS